MVIYVNIIENKNDKNSQFVQRGLVITPEGVFYEFLEHFYILNFCIYIYSI